MCEDRKEKTCPDNLGALPLDPPTIRELPEGLGAGRNSCLKLEAEPWKPRVSVTLDLPREVEIGSFSNIPEPGAL